MTNEHYTARLSDYLDGELPLEEREALEAHVAECEACAATLSELRALVREAGRLPERPPERDLWPEIEARLSPRGRPVAEADVVPLRRPRRVVMSVPQLIAAALALILFPAGGVWLAVGGDAAGPGSVAVSPESPVVSTVAFKDFDTAMASLEAEYQTRRDELDPETIRVLERNLAIIDQAIAEARDALASDPSSGFLSTHLANAMRQKMDLLRQASMIAQTEI